jgi:hypothetical protein
MTGFPGRQVWGAQAPYGRIELQQRRAPASIAYHALHPKHCDVRAATGEADLVASFTDKILPGFFRKEEMAAQRVRTYGALLHPALPRRRGCKATGIFSEKSVS